MKTTARDEASMLVSVEKAGNLGTEVSAGRAEATRHLPQARMQPVSLWVQHSGCATVVVVQTAEHGESDDLASMRRVHLRRHGNTLTDAPSTALRAGLMRAGVVEEIGVFPDHFGQMAFVEDEHVVETLAMEAGRKPFDVRIRVGRLDGLCG